MNRQLQFACVLVVFCAATTTRANPILQPVASGSSASADGGSLTHLYDQSGLSTGYTNHLTDFDAYIATNPTHDSSAFVDNDWIGFRPVGEYVDFDLGGSYTIESMALWNIGGNSGINLVNFRLYADDNPAFSSPTLLLSASANPNTGPTTAVLSEVFTFAPTTAGWVRMYIDSVVTLGTQEGAFGEVAFEVVPTPAAAVGGLVLLGGLATFRRRRNAVA
jgi:hypothetical protein